MPLVRFHRCFRVQYRHLSAHTRCLLASGEGSIMPDHAVHATPLHAAAAPAFPSSSWRPPQGGLRRYTTFFVAFPPDLPAAVAVVW